MTAKVSHLSAAGASLLIHIILICLAGFAVGSTSSAPSGSPRPIEIEIIPAQLIDMGSGKLRITSGSPPPRRRITKPETRPPAESPPSKEPAVRPQISVPVTEPLPPPLPGETGPTSVALASPGDDKGNSGSSGHGGGRSEGPGGGGTGASTGEGGSGYAGAGYGSGQPPSYPETARRAGREGLVTVRVLVGADGVPASVTVQVTSGHEDFDSVAVQAVKKWRFSPARRAGQPVASYHDVKIRFRLNT